MADRHVAKIALDDEGDGEKKTLVAEQDPEMVIEGAGEPGSTTPYTARQGSGQPATKATPMTDRRGLRRGGQSTKSEDGGGEGEFQAGDTRAG